MALAENYQMKYYMYHFCTWPQLQWVAVDHRRKIVGYVMAKGEYDDEEGCGQITSLAVFGTYRKLGIGTQLMRHTMDVMEEVFGYSSVTLQVRVSNEVAVHLYKVLGYYVEKIDKDYYEDGEDAVYMRKIFLTAGQSEANPMRLPQIAGDAPKKSQKESNDESNDKEGLGDGMWSSCNAAEKLTRRVSL